MCIEKNTRLASAFRFDAGEDALPKSHKLAFEWYMRALALGSAAAANNLGVLYDSTCILFKFAIVIFTWYCI